MATAGRGELLLDRGHLGLDDGAQRPSSARIAFELGDPRAQVGDLLLEVDPAQPGELAQLHLEDVGGLLD